MENITKLRKELLNIDFLLKNIDKALDSAQPNLAGKIRIYFFFNHGYGKPAEPTIVKRPLITKANKGKKIPTIKLPDTNLTKRAISKGQFARNYNQVVALLTLTSELLAYRKKISKAISDSEKVFAGLLKGNLFRIEKSLATLIKLDSEIKSNLFDAGLQDYYKELDGLNISGSTNSEYDDSAF